MSPRATNHGSASDKEGLQPTQRGHGAASGQEDGNTHGDGNGSQPTPEDYGPAEAALTRWLDVEHKLKNMNKRSFEKLKETREYQRAANGQRLAEVQIASAICGITVADSNGEACPTTPKDVPDLGSQAKLSPDMARSLALFEPKHHGPGPSQRIGLATASVRRCLTKMKKTLTKIPKEVCLDVRVNHVFSKGSRQTLAHRQHSLPTWPDLWPCLIQRTMDQDPSLTSGIRHFWCQRVLFRNYSANFQRAAKAPRLTEECCGNYSGPWELHLC